MDELKVIFEIEDLKYGNIKRCLKNQNVIYIIKDKVIEDKSIIEELETKYGFKLSDELGGIIF